MTGTSVGSQHMSVELTDEDMVSKFGQEKWDGLSLLDRHHAMMNAGDTLVVDYLRAAGLITPEHFRTRVREIRERYDSGS